MSYVHLEIGYCLYILWCSINFLGTASSLHYLKMYIKICLWPRIQKCFRYSERIRNDLVVSTTKYVMKIVATTVAVEKSVLSLGAALQRSTMLTFLVFRNSKGQCGILAKDVSDLVVSHGFALYLEVLPIL